MMLLANLNNLPFKKKVLSQALLVLCALNMPVYAMQVLDDDSMSDVTGEGIAFTIDALNIQFNGADDVGAGNANTGYARLLPVGALSQEIINRNTLVANGCGGASPPVSCTAAQIASASKYNVQIGKGDIYLYGLSISENDNNITTLRSTNAVNLGTSENPWLIAVKTVNTPNFNGVNKPLTYMELEAPLLTSLLKSDGTLLATDPNSYNLKLGIWADAFVRDSTKVEGNAAAPQFALNSIDINGNRYINGVNASGGLTLRENRFRLQGIINGVSLNGSNVKMFQTLDGADVASGLGATYKHYNNTLGLAATLRMNSGDARSVRAPVYSESQTDNTTGTTGTVATWGLVHGGWDTTLSTSQASGGCNNGGSVRDTANFGSGCQFMVQSGTRTDSKTRTVTKTSQWTAGSGLDNHVMRFSTQEKGTTQGLLSTPAIDGGAMPSFADTDGVFLYKPNINLVLGSQWQPLVLGVASDNKNLSLEVTRIPNQANVYKEIYTDYTGADATYKGGTCSTYWCGGDGNGISKNATHSSITIGTTLYTAPVNAGANKTPLSVSAYQGADAAGVSFGSLIAVQGQTLTNTGSTSSNISVTQARWIQRALNNATTWKYRDFSSFDKTGTANQWSYNGVVVNALSGVQNADWSTCCSAFSAAYDYPTPSGLGNGWTHNESGGAGSLCGNNNCTYYGNTGNRNWTVGNTKGLTFSTASNPALDAWLASQGSAVLTTDVSANQAPTPILPVVAQPTFNAVNLGSAVIDGLLIQHLKITTKGL